MFLIQFTFLKLAPAHDMVEKKHPWMQFSSDQTVQQPLKEKHLSCIMYNIYFMFDIYIYIYICRVRCSTYFVFKWVCYLLFECVCYLLVNNCCSLIITNLSVQSGPVQRTHSCSTEGTSAHTKSSSPVEASVSWTPEPWPVGSFTTSKRNRHRTIIAYATYVHVYTQMTAEIVKYCNIQ